MTCSGLYSTPQFNMWQQHVLSWNTAPTAPTKTAREDCELVDMDGSNARFNFEVKSYLQMQKGRAHCITQFLDIKDTHVCPGETNRYFDLQTFVQDTIIFPTVTAGVCERGGTKLCTVEVETFTVNPVPTDTDINMFLVTVKAPVNSPSSRDTNSSCSSLDGSDLWHHYQAGSYTNALSAQGMYDEQHISRALATSVLRGQLQHSEAYTGSLYLYT